MVITMMAITMAAMTILTAMLIPVKKAATMLIGEMIKLGKIPIIEMMGITRMSVEANSNDQGEVYYS